MMRICIEMMNCFMKMTNFASKMVRSGSCGDDHVVRIVW